MKDRELLVMAAQSIGLELVFHDGYAGYYKDCGSSSVWIPWDPTIDGSDAMRLVVQHGMLINRGIVTCRIGKNHQVLQRSFPVNPLGDTDIDEAAQALCRTITELAADIAQMIGPCK